MALFSNLHKQMVEASKKASGYAQRQAQGQTRINQNVSALDAARSSRAARTRATSFGGGSTQQESASMPFSVGAGKGSLFGAAPTQSRVTAAGPKTGVSQYYLDRKAKERLDALKQQQQAEQQQANQQAQQQYGHIQNLAHDTKFRTNTLFDEAGGKLENLGRMARTDIDENRQRQLASARQGLISSGLGNTTIQQSVNRGIESDAQRANLNVDEQVGRMQSGLLQNQAQTQLPLGNMLIDTALSRSNTNPNQGLLNQLILRLSQQGI